VSTRARFVFPSSALIERMIFELLPSCQENVSTRARFVFPSSAIIERMVFESLTVGIT